MNLLLKLFFSRQGILAAALLALLTTDAAAQTQLLHPTNTVWRYQTDLAVQQDAGTDWVNPGFDDSSWPEGKGLFGNESNYPYPMNTTGTGLGALLPIAVYYRTHFTWNGTPSGIVLRGTNYVDDGSIIYLNGVEIARFNMPATANAGTPEAFAPVANPGGYPNLNNGEPALVRLEIALDFLTNGNLNPLRTGDNVIAAQIHQNGTGSSDRVFGLALYGGTCAHPCFTGTQPTNRVQFVGRSTTFVAFEQCSFPTATFQWYRDIGAGEELIAGATGATYTLTNVVGSDAGLYYAKASNPCGTVTSRQASLDVPGGDPPSLVSGRLGANNLEIIVTADEPLCPDDSCAGNATLTFMWEVYVEGDQNQQLLIAGIVVNGNTLTFTLAPETPWAMDTRYVVGLLPFGGGSIGDLYGNILTGDDPRSSVTTPAAASAISLKGIMGMSDLYTFDEPPRSLEFSTFNWAGGAADVSSAATLNTFVQALDVSAITTTLPEATGNPPGGFGIARYASDTKNLITRPAGVLANVIVAHLRNDTGSAQHGLTVTYTLTDRYSFTSEEITGHLVYYSFNGAPNTWLPTYGLNTNGVSGSKTGLVAFASTPWPAGAKMYLLFADDNAVGAEGIYEIDNFQVRAGHVDPPPDTNRPALTRAIGPNNTTIVLTFSEKMAASAGTPARYSVSGATVTAASLNASGTEVTLTTTPRLVGNATMTITGLRDASAEANLIDPNPTTFNLTTVQKVVEWNASWEYNTNNLDAAPDWTTTGGTGWQTGNGLFGTEISPAATSVFPVPIATPIPPPAPDVTQSFLTSYYRKSIFLPALAAGQSYALGHYTDDGAVVYLDGVELGRFNMPAGAVSYSTLAAFASTEGVLHAMPFTASEGTHILAVEIHQNSLTSSDIVFGASVIIVPTASPSLTAVHRGTNAVVSWNADASWSLVGSTNVAGPYAPVAGAGLRSFSRPIATPTTQFYKLNYIPQP